MTKSNIVTTKVIHSSSAAKVIEPCDWTKQLNIPFSFGIFKFFHCVHVHLKMRLIQNSFATIRREFPSKYSKNLRIHELAPEATLPLLSKVRLSFFHAFAFFVKEKRSIICILPPWQSRYCWPGEEGHLLQQDLNVLVGAIARWNSPRRPWQHIFKNIMFNIDDMKYVWNFMFTTTWNVHYKNDTWQLDLPLWNEYHAKVPLGPQTHQHLSRSSSWTNFYWFHFLIHFSVIFNVDIKYHIKSPAWSEFRVL